MTRQKLGSLTDEELVAQFEIWARARGQAIIDGKIPAANRRYRKLDAVDQALRERGIPARRKLLSLLDHPDLLVRFHAAQRLLAVEPVNARAVLAEVKTGRLYNSLSAAASMTLRMLDDGSYTPT